MSIRDHAVVAHRIDGEGRALRDDTPGRGRAFTASLSGALVRLLLLCGPIGGGIFSTIYLIEGATRPGYSARQQAISALSLGPGGWVQRVNFAIAGLFACCFAIGLRAALTPGVGATWVPRFQAMNGIGFIICGLFSQDPASGYPVGAQLTHTMHGQIHLFASSVTIGAYVAISVILARRYFREPHGRGWAACWVAAALLTCVLMTIFGIAMAQHGPAGLFERLAPLPFALLTNVLVVHLWGRAGRVSPAH